MTPPNPLNGIKEAVERVLLESGATDFGRSMASFDDLTIEVRTVHQRVDEIEERMEQIVPLLERLVNVAEGLEREIQPISSLASKVPGSGSRKRRRKAQEARAALQAGSEIPTDPRAQVRRAAAIEDAAEDVAAHDGPVPGDAPGRPGTRAAAPAGAAPAQGAAPAPATGAPTPAAAPGQAVDVPPAAGATRPAAPPASRRVPPPEPPRETAPPRPGATGIIPPTQRRRPDDRLR
ncbi:hypothetical protein [Patulibacter sp. SYSU D01012]|uniref:hypothetical protein n=1 Tax=Patulibacter sp. SYSU D01012 TaxID=2817381 RepID=UPI001B30CB41|nr:hypothetical protein [Patulibacter sp. SYSU D01012]